MIRVASVFGFVVILALMFAAYTGTPEASVADAQSNEAPAKGCVTHQVSLDEGYAVTRTETRTICAAD